MSVRPQEPELVSVRPQEPEWGPLILLCRADGRWKYRYSRLVRRQLPRWQCQPREPLPDRRSEVDLLGHIVQ